VRKKKDFHPFTHSSYFHVPLTAQRDNLGHLYTYAVRSTLTQHTCVSTSAHLLPPHILILFTISHRNQFHDDFLNFMTVPGLENDWNLKLNDFFMKLRALGPDCCPAVGCSEASTSVICGADRFRGLLF